MGIGDGIEKAAENAMEDLAGISKPTDDGHVPEPGNPDENIRVHSSISEGSNAADNSDQTARIPPQAWDAAEPRLAHRPPPRPEGRGPTWSTG